MKERTKGTLYCILAATVLIALFLFIMRDQEWKFWNIILGLTQTMLSLMFIYAFAGILVLFIATKEGRKACLAHLALFAIPALIVIPVVILKKKETPVKKSKTTTHSLYSPAAYGEFAPDDSCFICTGPSSTRFHRKSSCVGNCSGEMRLTSIGEAQDLGYTPCGKCNPSIY